MSGDRKVDPRQPARDLPSRSLSSVARRALCPIVLAASVLCAYANSFAGVFLFDDRLHILDDDRRLTTLWPLWDALTRRRPVVDYSLALNRTLHGDTPWGYHAVNVTIHLLAALTLMGIVRRTLLLCGPGSQPSVCGPGSQPSLCGTGFQPVKARNDDRSHRSTSFVALVIAAVWAVHPLQTQSVTYLVQRAESLMGMFYLLTIYVVLRAAQSRRARLWFVAAVIFCALGMGSKAVMVTAPIVILFYDRVFLSGSWAALFRKRWGLYLGLATTWSVLWITGTGPAVLNPATVHSNVGFSFKGISPFDYALTQCGVLITYMRMCVWPHPLCLDYAWPVARSAGLWFFPGLVILSMLACVVWLMRRRPGLGFVAGSFFILLSPTSSIVPIRDPFFEHRMYLPLAAIIVLLVIIARAALQRLVTLRIMRPRIATSAATVAAVVVSASLGYATVRRNADYHGESDMWKDVLRKQPHSVRAAENYGTALLAEHRVEEALPALAKAVRVNPRSVEAQNGYGFALAAHRRYNEAMEAFSNALRLNPRHRRALVNLGNTLSDTGRTSEAIEHFQRVVERFPRLTDARLNLGNEWLKSGRGEDAIREYRAILAFDPDHVSAWRNLGAAMLNMGKLDESVQSLRRALEIEPDSPSTYSKLGIALASSGKADEAESAFQQAVRLGPGVAKTHGDFGKCLLLSDNLDGAVRQYRRAIALEPLNPLYHYELGVALGRQGHTAGAIEQYRRTLSLDPGDDAARRALDTALADEVLSLPEG